MQRFKYRLAVGLLCLLPVFAGVLAWRMRPQPNKPVQSQQKPDSPQQKLNAALITAVAFRDARKVNVLLKQGASANARGLVHVWEASDADQYKSPSALGSWTRSLGPHRQMAENDPGTERWEEGDTVLMLASRHAELEIVKLLLAAGADVNGRGEAGSTPLMQIVEGVDGPRSAIILLLAEHGADFSAKAEDGRTVWDLVQGKPQLTKALQQARARK